MLTEEDKNLQWVLYTDFNEAEKKKKIVFPFQFMLKTLKL